jgi:hypothetical protein
MKRPAEVTPICLVLIAAAGIGLFTYGDERGWAIEFSAMVSSIIVFMVVLGFWLGDRLCHRLLAFFAAWAMIRPVLLVVMDPSWWDKAVMLSEAALAVPLLVWLFTKRMDAFTRPVLEADEASRE